MLRRSSSAAALCALAFFSFVRETRAQGLEDAVTGAIVSNPQAAAADDAFALYVNPAGLAYVEALQLVGGYSGELGATPRDSFFGQLGFSPINGLTFAGGGGLVLRRAGEAPSYSFVSGSVATRFERLLALGATFTRIAESTPGSDARVLADVGAQLKPFSWLAVGAGLEGLGAVGAGRTAVRFGVSTRPLGDWLTFGVDARALAGAEDVLSPEAYTQARVVPAINALVRIGGLLVTGGASWLNVGQPGPLDVQVGVGVQVDTHHIGAAALGSFGTADRLQTHVLARASVERYPTVFPFGADWISLTLVDEGVPPQDTDTLLGSLLASEVHPVAVLSGLERAARDPKVGGVVLRVGGLSLGWGRLTELRDALLALRAAGKQVVVYFDSGADPDLYLASAADRVYVSPAGSVDLNGLQLVLTYYGAALRRFGVDAQAIVAGEFKNAPRNFTAEEPNEQELLVENGLLDAVFEVLVTGIAEGRDLKPEKVVELIDLGGLSASGALEAGLIDGLAYWDEIPDRVQDLAGYRPFFEKDYLGRPQQRVSWASPRRIAVVPIEGMIQMGRSGGGLFNLFGGGASADDIIEALDAAREAPDVAAVVLRVDSPGGDALASDLIWHAVMRLREVKPVVASMGDLAASGGYYVAAAANEIYAEPNTLTGSIGVYTLLFSAEELLSDLGVSSFELARGARPGPTLFRGLSEKERERYQTLIEQSYDRFLAAILAGRNIDEQKLREVAEGRVWTGADAKARDLVDTLGGLTDALARARELAGVPEAEETEISILTQGEELLPRLRTAVSALVGRDASREQVRAAARLLLGQTDDLQVLELEGRPLALPRARVHLE